MLSCFLVLSCLCFALLALSHLVLCYMLSRSDAVLCSSVAVELSCAVVVLSRVVAALCCLSSSCHVLY